MQKVGKSFHLKNSEEFMKKKGIIQEMQQKKEITNSEVFFTNIK